MNECPLVFQDEEKIIEHWLNGFYKGNVRVDRIDGFNFYVFSLHVWDNETIEHRLHELQLNFKATSLITELVEGIFFEFSNSNSKLFIFSPVESFKDNFENTYDQSTDSHISNQIVEFANRNNVDGLKHLHVDTFISIIVTTMASLANYKDVSFTDVDSIKATTTLLNIKNNMSLIDGGSRIATDSHVGAFSWIYYLESAFIRSAEKEGCKEVHDVGTNTAFLPIILAEMFPSMEVSCSDIDITPAVNSVKTLSDKFGFRKPSVYIKNLKDPGDDKKDIIICNDVLEHFEEVESEFVFRNLLHITGKYLLIHVPLEEVPSECYGHKTSFWGGKLVNWSKDLTDFKNITDDLRSYSMSCPDPTIIEGFLLLERVELS